MDNYTAEEAISKLKDIDIHRNYCIQEETWWFSETKRFQKIVWISVTPGLKTLECQIFSGPTLRIVMAEVRLNWPEEPKWIETPEETNESKERIH